MCLCIGKACQKLVKLKQPEMNKTNKTITPEVHLYFGLSTISCLQKDQTVWRTV